MVWGHKAAGGLAGARTRYGMLVVLVLPPMPWPASYARRVLLYWAATAAWAATWARVELICGGTGKLLKHSPAGRACVALHAHGRCRCCPSAACGCLC